GSSPWDKTVKASSDHPSRFAQPGPPRPACGRMPNSPPVVVPCCRSPSFTATFTTRSVSPFSPNPPQSVSYRKSQRQVHLTARDQTTFVLFELLNGEARFFYPGEGFCSCLPQAFPRQSSS